MVCQDLKQDQLESRALVNAGHSMIFDRDDSISGVYPFTKGSIYPVTRLEYVPGSGLYCLRTIQLSATKYSTMSGYSLWPLLLAHVPNATLRMTIEHSKGLEDLESASFSQDNKCPACMMGKGSLHPHPNEKERATRPLKRVNMDSFSSHVTSIEGYNHALIIV